MSEEKITIRRDPRLDGDGPRHRKVMKCPNCGHHLPIDTVTECDECGEWLEVRVHTIT